MHGSLGSLLQYKLEPPLMFGRDPYNKYNILVEIEKQIGNKMSSFHHGMYFWSDATSQVTIHKKHLWTHIRQFIDSKYVIITFSMIMVLLQC